MELVKKNEFPAIANVITAILVSAGLTSTDIKDVTKLIAGIIDDIPYGTNDICKEMNLTAEDIHNTVDKCLNHKLPTSDYQIGWLEMPGWGFAKRSTEHKFWC